MPLVVAAFVWVSRWFSGDGDDHPGAFDRIDIVTTFVAELYGNDPRAPAVPERQDATVARLMASLKSSAVWIASSEASVDMAEELQRSWAASGMEVPDVLSQGTSARSVQLEYAVPFGLLAGRREQERH